MKIHNKKSLEDLRRGLRKNATEAEDCLWQQLQNGKLNGIKFKRQHSIGNYIVDFYCASRRLIIELDGEVHDLNHQKEKDRLRDESLTEMGFKVMRFRNNEILSNVDVVKKEILKCFENTSS